MDLIDRNQLLQMIDKAERELERNRKFLCCRLFREIVNRMPSVVPDDSWEASTDALIELITEE